MLLGCTHVFHVSRFPIFLRKHVQPMLSLFTFSAEQSPGNLAGSGALFVSAWPRCLCHALQHGDYLQGRGNHHKAATLKHFARVHVTPCARRQVYLTVPGT